MPRNIDPAARIRSVSDLMGLWPSDPDFARDIGIKPNHAQTMKVRGSIPVNYWPATIVAAKQRRIAGVTADLLMKMHAGERSDRPGAEGTAVTAQVVKSGKSQAVELPKQFHFRGDEVEIIRRGEEVILREKHRGLGRAFELIANLPIENLADERDEPPQERKGL